MPLHKLFDGHSESWPSHASSDYNPDDKDLEVLRGEMQRYLNKSHNVAQMEVEHRIRHPTQQRCARKIL